MRIALSARLKLSFVEDANDVVDAWNSLHLMYVGSNLSRKFALLQEIANLMQGPLTVAKYFKALPGLWRELEAMREQRSCSLFDDFTRCQDNAKENQENKIMKFLMGLNESLAHIRTHILALKELPEMKVVFDMVCNPESEKNLTRSLTVEASAMFTNQQQASRHTYNGQQRNQQQPNSQGFTVPQRNYDGGNPKARQRPYCSYCQQAGHTKETCYKLNGYPHGHKLYKGKSNKRAAAANNVLMNPTEENIVSQGSSLSQISSNVSSTNPFTHEQVNQILAILKEGNNSSGDNQCHMAGICGLSSRSIKQNSWIIDSGATDHFVCDKDLIFDEYQLVNQCQISLPDGSSTIVTSAGKCLLKPDLVLQNVLLVPSFQFNLLSVGKLISEIGCSALFTEKICICRS
ncbi:unnamed protein product [Rhodiola kirilowii]